MSDATFLYPQRLVLGVAPHRRLPRLDMPVSPALFAMCQQEAQVDPGMLLTRITAALEAMLLPLAPIPDAVVDVLP